MYTVNKTRSRKKLFIEFIVTITILFVFLAFVLWFFIFRDSGTSSASFARSGGTVAVVAPATRDFTVDEFKISLPDGWELLGKKNPYSDQQFYEFQSKVKDYENRWLKVFIDIIPQDYALNKLLPIAPSQNKVTTGTISDNCKSFNGAPSLGSGQVASQTWKATWEDASFICNMQSQQNHVGTASQKDGYNVPITGPTKGTHTYFFVYIDHNVRPDDTILSDALKTFEAL